MYKYKDLRSLHLEITSLCNAKCPMCGRTEEGGKTNRHLPLKDLSLLEIKQIFPKSFAQQLWEVYLCGNYGDPVAAKDTIAVLTYFKECNPQITTKMHTNGSARSSKWWSELAQICDQVYFGIDGLGDTNPLYRIGTDFQKIIENAKAFIEAGGHAKWQYIVFKHNEHQIEEARNLAKTLGFKEFNLKKTGRFFSNSKLQVKQEKPVINSQGEVTHHLEMPTIDKFKNQALQKEALLIEKYGSMVNYLNQTQVDCQAVDQRGVYVSSEGLVFPCCWTANQMYVWYKEEQSGEIWNWVKQLPEGKNSISALRHSLESIIEGPFFQELIPQSWSCSSISEGKSWVCAKTCGKEFNPFQTQFEPKAEARS